MNQSVKNPMQQHPAGVAPQGNRPQGARPVGPTGQSMQQGRPMQPQQGRPMQQQVRPMQPQQARSMQQGRPMQPQQARSMQQGRPMQPQQGRPMQQQNQGNAPIQRQQSQQTTQSTQPQKPAANPYVPNFATDFNLPPSVISTKGILLISFVALILGMFVGNIFFGSSGSTNQKPTGLTGVIRNPDITTKLPRCGLIDRGQSCILYIMNSTRYDKSAEDFFDEAVKLTEIQKYSIAMVNLKYAKTRIPPGRFAEIKIPDMR